MDSMKYKSFNRVPAKPPPRAKTHDFCPKEPEPPPPPERYCRVPLKKHPSAHTLKYKMQRVCPRVDYRAKLCQPILICDNDDKVCTPAPKIRKKVDIDDDDSWLVPIPKPTRCPTLANPCANDGFDIHTMPPCKPAIPEYGCGKGFSEDD